MERESGEGLINWIRSLDIETTGNSPADGGIVEIGYSDLVAASFDLVGGPTRWDVLGCDGFLTNPGVPIDPEAAAVHHITDDDILDAPGFHDVARDAIPDLSDPLHDVIGAYAAFGAQTEMEWLGQYLGDKPIIDVYKAALRLWPEAPRHKNQVLRYWRNPDGMCRELASPAHRGPQDAYVTAFLLRDMLNDGADINDLIQWSKEPAILQRCYKGKYRNDGKGTPYSEVDEGFLAWMLDKDFSEDEIFSARYWLKKHEERRAKDQPGFDDYSREYDDVL